MFHVNTFKTIVAPTGAMLNSARNVHIHHQQTLLAIKLKTTVPNVCPLITRAQTSAAKHMITVVVLQTGRCATT